MVFVSYLKPNMSLLLYMPFFMHNSCRRQVYLEQAAYLLGSWFRVQDRVILLFQNVFHARLTNHSDKFFYIFLQMLLVQCLLRYCSISISIFTAGATPTKFCSTYPVFFKKV